MSFGDLEREERDAAGAEDEDGLAGAEVALFDERVPGGEGGAGEGCGFFVRVAGGCVDEAAFGEEVGGGEDAVDGAAEGGLAGGGEDGAVVPVLEEEAGDVVADFEVRDLAADGGDDAGRVGAGDAWQHHPGVVGAEHGHEVAVVERCGMELDEDIIGAGCGELDLFEREVVEAEGIEAEGGGGHECSLRRHTLDALGGDKG